MRIIKRLYLFILNSFLPLFAMTFFIVLFIVLMQFLYRFIDDLVGKGLSFALLGELFFYAALSMVPMALPLAILLASLMTFGNFGEKFELTAMKASGISLVRVMAPLIVTVSLISVGAFFFQNDVLPKAQVKMWTLLFSMRQKSPELEIPEGVFYDQIPGYNVYVREKNRDNGMLHGVMIYDVSRGGSNASVITSDSARMAMTPDMKHLYLHLWQGEQFENLRDQNEIGANVPFRRETFLEKEVLIPFDANFNRMDEEGMRKQYVGKNIAQLRHTMDSVTCVIDSVGALYSKDIRAGAFGLVSREMNDDSPTSRQDKDKDRENAKADGASKIFNVKISADSLLENLKPGQQVSIISGAAGISQRRQAELTFRAQYMADEKKNLRRHEIELIKKFTLSVACLIFFFIGAPLGAIIRKGGLGTPLVISVLLFLVYYIIDNTGYKMARDGHIIVWVGMWLSTFILAPLGIYVTWKAMNDSAVFDKDRYMEWLRRIVGARQPRKLTPKEVIINDIDRREALSMLRSLAMEASRLDLRMIRRPGYAQYWRHGIGADDIARLSDNLEMCVEYLSDSRDPMVVSKLADYPMMRSLWVYRPARSRWLQTLLMWAAPVGLPIYLLAMHARKGLRRDLQAVADRSDLIAETIEDAIADRGIS